MGLSGNHCDKTGIHAYQYINGMIEVSDKVLGELVMNIMEMWLVVIQMYFVAAVT